MQRIQETLDQILGRLNAFEKRFDSIDARLDKMTVGELTVKQKNALRRQHYREQKAQKLQGRLTLPTHHCFERNDRRLREQFEAWAQVGLKKGAENRPEEFISWLVYQWNTMLIKEILCLGTLIL